MSTTVNKKSKLVEIVTPTGIIPSSQEDKKEEGKITKYIDTKKNKISPSPDLPFKPPEKKLKRLSIKAKKEAEKCLTDTEEMEETICQKDLRPLIDRLDKLQGSIDNLRDMLFEELREDL